MNFNCFVVFLILAAAKASRSQGDKHSKQGALSAFFKDIKPMSQQTTDANITRVETEEHFYETWSQWSPCRKCRKVRKKNCISSNCQGSTLYEERPCDNRRCRRKYSYRNNNSNILQRLGTRELEEDDRVYTKWTEWTTCSKQCITRRHRYCKKHGSCLQNPDVQMAYCYKERSECHKWIESMLNRQTRNQKYAYDTTAKRYKKPKKRKCGVAYRTVYSKYSPMMKVMGGTISKSTKWPWHVALLNWHKEVFCGGSLISPNWVMTAAHCLRNILYVRLNEYDISYDDGSEIEYRIIKMFPHYDYNAQTVDNDIALLKLPKSVPLPYACLPNPTAVLPDRQNCTIVGWGKRAPFDPRGSKYLREAQMPVVPKPICKRAYRRYTITENMFCAGYKNGGIDTCSGDSGGGFMCLPKGKRFGWTVQGITSFGEGCGKKGKYGIYTDVRKYIPWIKQKIKSK